MICSRLEQLQQNFGLRRILPGKGLLLGQLVDFELKLGKVLRYSSTHLASHSSLRESFKKGGPRGRLASAPLYGVRMRCQTGCGSCNSLRSITICDRMSIAKGRMP